MRIKRITIKNYRSFDDKGIQINLPDIKIPFSVVGHNNSGKSNFINALAMCVYAKAFSNTLFDDNDFYLKDISKEVLVEVEVGDPLKSSDAFNQVKDMPIFQLKIKQESGIFETSHYFCDENGKAIYNPRAVKRSQTKTYSDEDKKVLNTAQKQGAEQVWKWRDKIPIYFIDTSYIEGQLKINRYTLFGKVMSEIKKNFEAKDNVVEKKDGVLEGHTGKPRKEIFDNTMQYLEKYVLSTQNLDNLISSIEEVIKKQLEIEAKNLSLKFGFPSADVFFNNLSFYFTDNPKKPQLPVSQMGKGFLSLFVVALFRSILNTNEGGNIFIIEEPETFLHEHFQEYFYKILCDLAKNNQVIYTTHSKKFVNIFKPQSIIRLKNVDYLKSEVIYKDGPDIDFPEELDGFSIKEPDDFAKYMRSLEPNLGNIIFADRVVIVEGPLDLLVYKNIFNEKVNFELKNIALISAWGKDPIKTMVQLCKRFEIAYFVIHDWDLDDENTNISNKPSEDNQEYKKLDSKDKAQYTKNYNILQEVGSDNIHHNKRNLESVLNIKQNDKTPAKIFAIIKDKSFDNIKKDFPNLINQKLLTFLNIN